MENNYLAPNGKKSNLTNSQYKLVRTKAFKDWFGDWQNDPANASKVVDENGEPLVVYHGSKSNEEFNVFKQSSRFEFIYFAKTKEYAWLHFTKDIIDKPFQLRPFFLNIRNLLNGEEYGFEKVDFSELKSFFYGIHELSKDIQLNPKSQYRFWEVLRFSNDIYDSLKNQDYYDGISFYENFYDNTTWNDTDDYSLSYVVMYPNQIKLADGTNTTYDLNNKDIRFEQGGMTNKGYVSYKDKYNTKYGYKNGESHDLKEISKDTGVSIKGLQQIYNKGIGAYKTNPQSVRPNVKSKEQWAMARVYSAVMGGKASKIDSNELKMNLGGNVHLGESTEFYERTYADGTKERFSIEDYEKNIYPLLEKEMENKKFNDGGAVGKINYADGRKFRIRVKQKKG